MGFLDEFKRLAHPYEDEDDEEFVDDYEPSPRPVERRERERSVRSEPSYSSPAVDELEARLYELSQLKRRMRRSIPEILRLREEITENLSFLDACGLDLHRLEKQERELYRKFHRLLVAPVIRVHPFRNLRIEYRFLGELAEPCLYIPGCGVCIPGNDIAPVTLAVYEQVLLSEIDEGVFNRGISVRMELHRFPDKGRNLCMSPVIHPVHRMEYSSLDRLEPVGDIRDSPLENDI